MEYNQEVTGPRQRWHHKKAQLYQMRMKRRPTRAERRFDGILDRALKGFDFPLLKPTQVHRRGPRRKFKKQRIFEDQHHRKAYIVDFYIPAVKLAIEVDGPSHDAPEQQEYDATRTAFLGTRGVSVLRITNDETLHAKALIRKIIAAVLRAQEKGLERERLKSNPAFYNYLYGYVPGWATNKVR